MAAPHDEPMARAVVEHAVLHHGRVFDVVADRVDLGGPAPVLREYTAHPGAVAVIALDDEDRVLLLSQYRHPARRELWEPPAGIAMDRPTSWRKPAQEPQKPVRWTRLESRTEDRSAAPNRI